jgi:hypothetical protein
MSAIGTKRTFGEYPSMSAFGCKADIAQTFENVRLAPRNSCLLFTDSPSAFANKLLALIGALIWRQIVGSGPDHLSILRGEGKKFAVWLVYDMLIP